MRIDKDQFRLCRIGSAAVLALAVAGQLAGCGSSKKETPAEPTVTLEAPKLESTVISSRPEADARAFNEASEQLSDADWTILEQLGPKTIWQQLGHKYRKPVERPESSSTIEIGVAPSEPATTQPVASTIDESKLPIEITELAGDRVRMIWRLRGYGGSTVRSSRDASTSRRNVDVSAGDLAPLVTALTPLVGDTGAIVPIPLDNVLVITCDNQYRPGVIDLLSRLDIAPRQVEITAKIFEVSQDFDFQHGANVIVNRLTSDGMQSGVSTFSAQRFVDAMKDGSPTQGSVVRLMQAFQSAGININMSFQILAEEGLVTVVSSPRMTVSVGHTGYMLAGQELPVQSAKIVNGVLQTDTSYKPVGVQLYVTPQTVSSDRVKLHAISIVSAVSGFAPLPSLYGDDMRMFLNPIIDSREAETAVTVSDGDTLVISGLKMVRTTSRENKVPGLGDLPIMGALFKNHRTQQQSTDLYFFLTPTLLASASY